MWIEIRIPQTNKLLFRINRDLSLIESSKHGWKVVYNYLTNELIQIYKT